MRGRGEEAEAKPQRELGLVPFPRKGEQREERREPRWAGRGRGDGLVFAPCGGTRGPSAVFLVKWAPEASDLSTS